MGEWSQGLNFKANTLGALGAPKVLFTYSVWSFWSSKSMFIMVGTLGAPKVLIFITFGALGAPKVLIL